MSNVLETAGWGERPALSPPGSRVSSLTAGIDVIA